MKSPLDSLAAGCAELHLVDVRKPGVYILLDGNSVAYIGESNNVLARVGMHARAFAFDRILYVAEASKRERRAIESALARRFAPSMSDVFSRRDVNRDVEILSRFGLTPDAENARLIGERASACWSKESRESTSRAIKFHAERRRKLKARFQKLGIAWNKSWRVRDRLVYSRLLWNAIKPLIEVAAS